MATALAPRPAPAQHEQQPERSLIADMARHYGLKAADFYKAVKETIFDNKGSEPEMMAFLLVANRYHLDPFTKEIYAFPKKGGGIQPIVSVDGWLSIINNNPEMDGIEYVDTLDDNGELISVTCRIYRKDRSKPTECTEYMKECKRNTDPWRQWPRRMLRHKATIQCGRIAFSISGIMEPDEAERAESVGWAKNEPAKVSRSELHELIAAQKAAAERQPDLADRAAQANGEHCGAEPVADDSTTADDVPDGAPTRLEVLKGTLADMSHRQQMECFNNENRESWGDEWPEAEAIYNAALDKSRPARGERAKQKEML